MLSVPLSSPKIKTKTKMAINECGVAGGSISKHGSPFT
jgi:hypothetical protein